MISKGRKISHLFVYLAGFISAACLMLLVSADREVEARDPYACIRTDLDAKAMTGNIPDPDFQIYYEIPGCYAEAGYSATHVYLSGGRVVVRYEK